MELYFFELGVVLIIASIVGVLFKAIRQPLILAYIVTGLLLGPIFLKIVVSEDLISTFSTMGITFLLFMVGLELDLRKVKNVGKAAIITSIGHFVLGGILGFFISRLFGIAPIPSIYIGLALVLSSTVIVVKLLTEQHDNNSLYARISLGILVVQDIIAILALIFLDVLRSGQEITLYPFFVLFIKAAVLISVVFAFSTYVLPHVFRYISKSQELLFVLSVAWAFLISIFSFSVGLSVEIGAFIAGLSLAYLPYSFEIVSRVKSLRDFFLILFFVALGTNIAFNGGLNLLAVVVLSLSVLILHPIIIMIILGFLGYSKRTSFLTGISIAQVSEFSLVIVGMGFSMGHISQEIVSLILLVSVITMVISTYFITFGGKIYHVLKGMLDIFERGELKEHAAPVELKVRDHVVVIGHHVMGSRITEKLRAMKKNVVVVDFDPEVISNLKCRNVSCVYGDVEDPEIFSKLHFDNASMVISTIPDLKTNLFLIKNAKRMNPKSVVLVCTGKTEEAFELYESGADYVILPYVLGGEHSSLLIEKIDNNPNHIKTLKSEHIKELRRKSNLYSFF